MFKVNNYITLKLENRQTVIYINNERFLHCKHILLNIPLDKKKVTEEIDSIDDAIEKLDINAVQQGRIEIAPKEEFWGHCSNLSAWAELNYDTRILHRNLAFPLLQKLTEVGDLKAKRVFKEEIVQRIESGNLSVTDFLLMSRYTKNLSNEEKQIFFLKNNPNLLSNLKNFKVEVDNNKFLIMNILIQLIILGDLEAKEILQEIYVSIIQSRNLELIPYLLREDYKSFFYKTELQNFFLENNPNLWNTLKNYFSYINEKQLYDYLMRDNYIWNLKLLEKLLKIGDKRARELFLKNIKSALQYYNLDYFKIQLAEEGFFQYLTWDELIDVLGHSKLFKILNEYSFQGLKKEVLQTYIKRFIKLPIITDELEIRLEKIYGYEVLLRGTGNIEERDTFTDFQDRLEQVHWTYGGESYEVVNYAGEGWKPEIFFKGIRIEQNVYGISDKFEDIFNAINKLGNSLKTWCEEGYNNRYLNRKIAFPLLFEMIKDKNLRAIKSFKTDIKYLLGSEDETEFDYLKLLFPSDVFNNFKKMWLNKKLVDFEEAVKKLNWPLNYYLLPE